jgi:serine/threonine-protein kinase mTOR
LTNNRSSLFQIIPAFAAVTRGAAARVQDFHLQQLAILVGIVRQHVRSYMLDIINLILELWDNALLHLPLISLIEALGTALDAEFRPFLPEVLPLILRVFDGENSPVGADKITAVQMKIFDAFLTFGANIEEYLHLVIPIIVKTYERPDAPAPLRKRAIQAIDGLIRKVNFSDHASRIIHPLVRVLRTANNELRMSVMDTLCSLVIQLGSDFAIFIPTINKVSTVTPSIFTWSDYLSQTLINGRISHPKYESLISKLLNGERLPRELGSFEVLCVDRTSS